MVLTLMHGVLHNCDHTCSGESGDLACAGCSKVLIEGFWAIVASAQQNVFRSLNLPCGCGTTTRVTLPEFAAFTAPLRPQLPRLAFRNSD